jgi:phosphoglycerate dehydrogenase-like enzyme
MFKDPLSRPDFIPTSATEGAAETLSVWGNAPAPNGSVAIVDSPTVRIRPSGEIIKIVSAERLTQAEVDKIRSAGKDVNLVVVKDRAQLKEQAVDAEVILGTVDVAALAAARKLRWVQSWAAGVETLPGELMQHPCILTNMQRVFAPVIAETAFALILSLTRGLAQSAIPSFLKRQWTKDEVPLMDLYRKTLGVVGMGGIGTETSRRAYYGFGMNVLAVDAQALPKPEFVAALREPEWLLEMVPQVDVLMCAAPLTQKTRQMFNESVFRKMKPTAYFINVSRGGLVNQEDLARALKEKWIGGAGLDVTTPEPLPPDDPLWECPNLVITPHNSGMAPIRQLRLIALVVENVRRYCLGLPLMNIVDKKRGY